MSYVGRLLGVSLLALVACSSGDPSDPGPERSGASPYGGTDAAPVTFHRDVEPILQGHCQKCHTAGGLAPFALGTYEAARDMAPAMVAQTAARTMPPWGARYTSECKPRLPWNHDERLTEAQIDTLAKWNDAGAPEGDPHDAPPTFVPPPIDLPNATHILAPRVSFTASGDDDEFRCFVLENPFPKSAYIGGIQIVPGNPKVVHNAVVFTDPTGAFAARAGADGSFDCGDAANAMAGGNMALGGDDSVTLDVWTPGAAPVDLPPSIAMLAQGEKMILQIHYSPGGGGPARAPDLTKVELRVASARPDYLLYTTAFGNYAAEQWDGDGLQPGPEDRDGLPTFLVPKNAVGHTETMRVTIPSLGSLDTYRVYGVLAHAHLAGVDVKIDLTRGTDSQCLLEDAWDYHWQRLYTYASPVEDLPTLEKGDVLTVRCTYDNTMMNKRLGPMYAARGLTPIDLHLGDQTMDEMCLAVVQVLVENPL